MQLFRRALFLRVPRARECRHGSSPALADMAGRDNGWAGAHCRRYCGVVAAWACPVSLILLVFQVFAGFRRTVRISEALAIQDFVEIRWFMRCRGSFGNNSGTFENSDFQGARVTFETPAFISLGMAGGVRSSKHMATHRNRATLEMSRRRKRVVAPLDRSGCIHDSGGSDVWVNHAKT